MLEEKKVTTRISMCCIPWVCKPLIGQSIFQVINLWHAFIQLSKRFQLVNKKYILIVYVLYKYEMIQADLCIAET